MPPSPRGGGLAPPPPDDGLPPSAPEDEDPPDDEAGDEEEDEVRCVVSFLFCGADSKMRRPPQRVPRPPALLPSFLGG